jgi:MarR family transcriptional regulator, transcriptional regulator for hemolysin
MSLLSRQEISIFDIPEFSFGRKFSLLGNLYFSVLSQRLKHLGIEKNFSILVLIDKMGDHCSQKFIAETLHMDKTMMVGVLDHLEALDFIKRTQNPSDRRQYWIQLTEKGKAHMPEIKEVVRNLNESALAGLNLSEAAKFQKQLQLIYKNIQTISQS